MMNKNIARIMVKKINFHNACNVPWRYWVWATSQTHLFPIPTKGTKIETIIKRTNE